MHSSEYVYVGRVYFFVDFQRYQNYFNHNVQGYIQKKITFDGGDIQLDRSTQFYMTLGQ